VTRVEIEVKGNARAILPFKEKSIDVSLACEILENLPKHDSYLLLNELERVSRSLIICLSPMVDLERKFIETLMESMSVSGRQKSLRSWL
jgi:ubiquinone/menaquinone biosynthesis C-methylase UbiE